MLIRVEKQLCRFSVVRTCTRCIAAVAAMLAFSLDWKGVRSDLYLGAQFNQAIAGNLEIRGSR